MAEKVNGAVDSSSLMDFNERKQTSSDVADVEAAHFGNGAVSATGAQQ